MPKLKSHSGMKKRVKITGSGRLMRNCSGNSHLATKKRKERKRRLSLKTSISKANIKAVKKLMG
ncbi:MAG: 50S ribosomal protein L35 [bacterium]